MSQKKNRFNSVAGVYDFLAYLVFGNDLKTAQRSFLERIPDNARVLIIGGGTGWILEALLAQKAHVDVVYIEASSKMLSLSEKRVGPESRVSFIHGTDQDIPKARFDCIITNFFLDVFHVEDLPAVMHRLKEHLSLHGIWLCTDFRSTGKSRHRLLIRSMHLFFRLFAGLEVRNLVDFKEYFNALHMSLEDEKVYRDGLIFSSVYRIKK